MNEKVEKILEEIDVLTVQELAELVKAIEEKYEVSATAVAAAPAAAGAGEAAAKSEFNVELTEIGGNKIQVIKVVKDVLGVGLKDAKDLVEKAPAVIKENVPAAEAEELKAKIEEAGATVTLK